MARAALQPAKHVERAIEVGVAYCGTAYATTALVRYRVRRKIGTAKLTGSE